LTVFLGFDGEFTTDCVFDGEDGLVDRREGEGALAFAWLAEGFGGGRWGEHGGGRRVERASGGGGGEVETRTKGDESRV
jgi:hypothetical protein